MDFGFLSIVPPLIAITLALKTKEVISSLFVGIFAGALIYAGSLIGTIETVFEIMTAKMSSNSAMILFLALLGCLVIVVTRAGGSEAYGKWATTKIKSKFGAGLATAALGMIIFIDDYFNCLTVGTVMRPVTDKYNISRAKLAYIIDSTAAPICIIAPVSSWAASVIVNIGDAGVANPLQVFLNTIPFNLYAILTIMTVLYFTYSTKEIGVMASFEENDTSMLVNTEESYELTTNAKVYDLVLPILTLIIATILSMLYTGGFFTGASISEAFGNASVNISLVYGAFAGILMAFILFVPRKLLSFNDFMSGMTDGVKSMVGAIIILVLAWTIGGICSSDYLNTGGYVGQLMESYSIPGAILPAIVFVVASLLAFSTGTAWGTFGILIPILVPIIIEMGIEEQLVVILAAIFSGSVFGDHCSPISDTTILSSAGAQCNHIDHVRSQIPYAMTVAFASLVGFIVAGFTNNVFITFATSVITLVIAIYVARNYMFKNQKA